MAKSLPAGAIAAVTMFTFALAALGGAGAPGCVGTQAQREIPGDACVASDTGGEQNAGGGQEVGGGSRDGCAGGSANDSGTSDGDDAHVPATRPVTQGNATHGSPLRPLDNFHTIAGGRAYRSGQLAPDTLKYIIEMKRIRTVVNLRGPNPGSGWYQDERAACEAAGVRLVDVALSASSLPTRENALALYDLFEDPSAEPLLIHCRGGADRSGMVAAMWRREVLGEDRAVAAKELSWVYGHFEVVHPEMDEFIRIFEPSRDWIVNEYNPTVGGADAADD